MAALEAIFDSVRSAFQNGVGGSKSAPSSVSRVQEVLLLFGPSARTPALAYVRQQPHTHRCERYETCHAVLSHCCLLRPQCIVHPQRIIIPYARSNSSPPLYAAASREDDLQQQQTRVISRQVMRQLISFGEKLYPLKTPAALKGVYTF